jgi:hypothetical protein
LQKHVLDQKKKIVNLIVRQDGIRWYQRLIKLKKYIKLALADIGKSDLYSERMFIVLEDILQILKPIELAVKKLNKDEATLLTSEGVFCSYLKN